MEQDALTKLKIDRAKIPAPGGRRRFRGLLLVVLLLLAAAGVYEAHRRGLIFGTVTVTLTSVTFAYPSQVITELNASGYVVAQRKAAVASKGTGRLTHLAVVEGSRVKAGDILARIESDDVQEDLGQAKAQLAAARAEVASAESDRRLNERDWKRMKSLWERGVISLQDFDRADDRYKRSQAALRAAEANVAALEAAVRRAEVVIEYTLIRAPFDGVVLTKNADVGEVVAPFGSSVNAKAAVVTMADMSSLLVEADVAEAFLAKVSPDQPCEIQLDSLPGVRFPGKVAAIVPTADRTRGTVLVKVAFDTLDPRILPEMSARAAFLSRPLAASEHEAFLAVHKDAVVERGGEKGIFVVQEGVARFTPTPGVTFFGDFARLAPPWKAGDRVVLKPSPEVKTGTRVQAAE